MAVSVPRLRIHTTGILCTGNGVWQEVCRRGSGQQDQETPEISEGLPGAQPGLLTMPASWALAEFGFGESQRPHLTSAMFCLCVLGGWLYLPKTLTSPMRSQFTAFLCSAFFHGSHLLSACQALPRTSRLPPCPLFSSISAIGSQFLSLSPHWLNFVPPGGQGHPCLGAFASAALRVALVPEDTHGSDFCSPLTCLLPTDLICLPRVCVFHSRWPHLTLRFLGRLFHTFRL